MADTETAAPVENEITVEDAGPCRKRITVTVPAQHVDSELDRAFHDLIRNAIVPGFRPGHLPRRVAEARFGKAVRDEIRGDLMERAFADALDRHSLVPLGRADLENAGEGLEVVAGAPFRFQVVVEVRPTITVPSTEGIRVRRPPVEITDADVDRAVDDLRRERAEQHPAEDGRVGEGDLVVVDIAVLVDGERVLDAENVQYRHPDGVVAGIALPDLAREMLGREVDGDLTLKATLPANFKIPAHAGKEGEFRLTIRDVKRTVLPAADEAFAAALDFDSLAELREEVRRAVHRAREEQADRAVDAAILDALLERAPIELPEGIVRKEIGQVLARYQADLHLQGVPEDVIERRLAEVQAQAAETVAREFRVAFLVEEIARKRAIIVTESEVAEQIGQMAVRYERTPEEMRALLELRGLLPSIRGRLRERKVLDALRSEVTVEG